MDGFNHAASVSEVRQVVALKRDRVFGHYALVTPRFVVGTRPRTPKVLLTSVPIRVSSLL